MGNLLRDLCQAVAKDAEQENRACNKIEIKPKNKVDQHLLKSSSERLVELYVEQCANEGVHPCDEHRTLLKSIPEELVLDTSKLGHLRLKPGGAVLRVTGEGTDLQLTALLSTLAPPRNSPVLAVIDTLDLTGLPVSENALRSMLEYGFVWGPWWRLRCLSLQNCNLQIPHLKILCRADMSSSLWNLEYLDLSKNPGIGNHPNNESLREPRDFGDPDLAFLFHLWRNAKLRYLNLEGTNISMESIKCMMMVLRSYKLAGKSSECGALLHQGSRYTFECLILGRFECPSQHQQAVDFVAEFSRCIKCLPNLTYLGLSSEINGLRVKIKESWQSIQQEKVILEEEEGLRVSTFDLDCLRMPMAHLMPCFEFSSGDLRLEASDQLPQDLLEDFGLSAIIHEPAADYNGSAPVSPRVSEVDKYNLNILSPSKHSVKYTKSASNQIRRCSFNADIKSGSMNFRQMHREKSAPVRPRSARKHDKRNLIYTGGDRNDLLPLEEIEILSESGMYMFLCGTWCDGAFIWLLCFAGTSGGHNGVNASESYSSERSGAVISQENPVKALDAIEQVTAEEKGFRIRDGILDEDSRLGKKFRADARRHIMKIHDVGDQKAAKRAFKLWDQCAENSWDRRRWDNPSKTQNDEPHILGQLNLLFDILSDYDLSIGFPFPLWRKGQGEHAFEKVSNDVRHRNQRCVQAHSPADKDIASGSQPSPKSLPRCASALEIIIEDGSVDRSPVKIKKPRVLVVTSDEEEGYPSSSHAAMSHAALEKSSEIHSGKRKKSLRELNRLSAWAWDSRVEEHPPNVDVFGLATGKRQRKLVQQGISVDVENVDSKHRDRDKTNFMSTVDIGFKSRGNYDWSSDDEVPLFGNCAEASPSRPGGTIEQIIPDSQKSE
jgi:hypothetical protein